MAQLKNTRNPLLYAAFGAGLVYLGARIYRHSKRTDFTGRTVVITGGARGLGLALARDLSDRGARVVICSRNEKQLTEARRQLEQAGAEVLALQVDLRNEQEVLDMMKAAIKRYGRIDALINNAGVMTVGPENVMGIEDYKTTMESNTWSALHCIKAIIPYFKKQGGGHIVNISSIGGVIAVPHMLPYSVSKFALQGLSLGMAAELSKDRIKVMTVVPGLMRTGSPRNVAVKGNHQAEYAWFKIADSLPVLSVAAQSAARCIVDSMEAGKQEIVLTIPAKVAALMQGFMPRLMVIALSIVNRLLPSGVDETIRKGYESESRITRSSIARKADRAAVDYNQF